MIHLLWLSLLIPVAIHLVHRRKAKVVPFSTLRFLRMVDQRVARRHRLKELLLLALRLLLLAALVTALYRPMIRSATFRGADVPTAAAIVLDNSYSMRAATAGTTRFGRAGKAASQVLQGLRRGDAACLVPFDTPGDVRPELTTGVAALRGELEARECGWGAATADRAVEKALEALRGSDLPRKELYLVSDFQRRAWSTAVHDLAARLPPATPVFLVDVGGETPENLAVEAAEFGLNVQVAGAAATVSCVLRNTGPTDATAELELLMDGARVARADAAVAAGGVGRHTLRHVFGRTGAAAVQVRTGPDGLEADNVRHLVAHVHEKLPVLLVNGQPSAVPYLNETFYLDLALRAPAAKGETLSPLRTTTVTTADFLRQLLEDYACVILANVPRLSGPWAGRLHNYVRQGGGLILFPGDRTDADDWNSAAAEDLLPGLLERVVHVPEGAPLGGIESSHPVFRDIAEHLDRRRVRVERFFRVSPATDAATIAALDGDPLMLEREFGTGRVVLFSTSADMDWTNLPARPFYLPVLQQTVYYVARSSTQRSGVAVDSPYVLDLPASARVEEVRVHGPEEGEEPLAVLAPEPSPEGPRLVFRDTRRPGVYRASYRARGESRAHMFAVNVDPEESDLDRIEPRELEEALAPHPVRVVRDPAEVRLAARRERRGTPLWNYFFALAILLALAESYVGNAMLRQ